MRNNSEDLFESIITMIVFFVVIFFIVLFGSVIWASWQGVEQPPDYTKAPVKLETNRLGCTKYRYYNDIYWKCPEGTGVSSFEERQGKSTVLTPVVEQKTN